MARSSYVYVAIDVNDEPMAAFTVKHELVSWLAGRKQPEPGNPGDPIVWRVVRLPDGEDGKVADLTDELIPRSKPDPLPDCPTCGARPVCVEIGTETQVTVGMAPIRQAPSKQGPQVRCANGHWYTKDGHPSGGPISYTVREGPA